MPYEAKTNWKYDDTVTEKDLNRIEQGLKDAHVAEYKDITLQPGVQIVDVPEDTPFRMGEIRGRTLINLLGQAGKCDDPEAFYKIKDDMDVLIDTTNKAEGTGSLLLVSRADNTGYLGVERQIKVSPNGYYVVVAMARNITAAHLRLQVAGNPFKATDTTSYGAFEPLAIPFTPSELGVTDQAAIQLWIKTDTTNTGGSFDAVRVYEITKTEYNAIDSMTAEQVAARYPYIDSMTNVTNPYAITTNGNLLPPFTEWGESAQLAMPVSSPYEIKLRKTSSNEFATKTTSLSLPPNTAFTFIVEVDADFSASGTYGAYLNVFSEDGNGTGTSIELKTTAYRNTSGTFSICSDFTVPSNSNRVRVLVGIDAQSTGNFIFKNPMLIPGDKPQPFTPESCSMWAAECQLASNPVDGSNADVLFSGEDGLPYVLEKWNKVVLDGSLKWEHDNAATYKGFKRIRVPVASGVPYSQYVVKFDGKILPNIDEGVNWETVDLSQLYKNEHLYLSVSNVDSGWGDAYTPTGDEIKAYFFGWRMNVFAGGYDSIYNGSGVKEWHRIDVSTGKPIANTGVTTTPTSSYQGYKPYRLQYLKTKPTAEPINIYESGLTLLKGWNMVEVDSGVAIREKADPRGDSMNMYLHSRGHGNRLKYLVGGIYSVYRNGRLDGEWTTYDTSMSIDYGVKDAQCPLNSYDPTAIYHVTYTMLDQTLTAPIKGSIATNLRSALTEVVQWAGDAERRLSVVETKKAEKDTKLQFIKPTLLNDWKLFGESGRPEAGYCRDRDGFVYLTGVITGGTIGVTGKPAFVLPVGYRPKRLLSKIAITTSSSNAAVDITADGGVYIITGDNYFIALDTISPFFAEQ
ncbi:hypothetical protein [Paenibacillus alvei]|uniref:Uncharacterized protein n=1 Tax=Paenibacillus alvei TaxID=44250 RepID=A0AAP7DH85_PAEAL|nr:hypothetical protein [Paenibacillus alvei]NOJ70312.1 hypothetical protein [Paenibacillus alvei]